jgi:hypothetical protein
MTVPARSWGFLAPTPCDLVRFERREAGREVALVGVIEVGMFAPADARAPHAFCWRIFLPDCPNQLGRARTPEHARSTMRAKIEQWIEAADLKGARA